MPVIGSLLALAMLLPVGTLFLQHWQELGRQKSFASTEQDGLEYVVSLSLVTLALTDAQSAAVSGRPVPHDQLTAAIAATTAVDDRIGEQLRVSERWSQLRGHIEQLSGTEHADARAGYSAYREATDLLLDLHTKLRETSGLIQDPDTDVYYLQDAATEELPEALVAAGRLVDLVVIAAAGPTSAQAAENAEISVARVEVTSPVADLAVDLQAALDRTESRTLSSNVLNKLDHLLRQKDTLLAAVPADGQVAAVGLPQLTDVLVELQAAAAELLDALLVEMDALIASRFDGLVEKQRTAVALLAVAVLLTAGLLWVSVSGTRSPGHSRRRRPAAPDRAAREAGAVTPDASAAPRHPAPAQFAHPERAGAL